MKKLIPVLSLISYLTLTPKAFAAIVNACPTGQFSVLCSIGLSNFQDLVGGLLQLILAIGVIVALFYLVWGGFKWITSGGDKGEIMQARSHIVAAIVGLIVMFASYFILNIVLGFFSVGSLTQINVPEL